MVLLSETMCVTYCVRQKHNVMVAIMRLMYCTDVIFTSIQTQDLEVCSYNLMLSNMSSSMLHTDVGKNIDIGSLPVVSWDCTSSTRAYPVS